MLIFKKILLFEVIQMSRFFKPVPGQSLYILVKNIRDDFLSAISKDTDYMPSSIKELLEIVSLLLQFASFNAKLMSDDILLLDYNLDSSVSSIQQKCDDTKRPQKYILSVYIQRAQKYICSLIDEINELTLSIDDELKLVSFLKENKEKFDESLDAFLKSDDAIRAKLQANNVNSFEDVIFLIRCNMAGYKRARTHFIDTTIHFTQGIVGFYQPLAELEK